MVSKQCVQELLIFLVIIKNLVYLLKNYNVQESSLYTYIEHKLCIAQISIYTKLGYRFSCGICYHSWNSFHTFCECTVPRVSVAETFYNDLFIIAYYSNVYKIGSRVKSTESRHVEYKAGGGNYSIDHLPNDVRRYGSAFLNTSGGCLCIGVKDDGKWASFTYLHALYKGGWPSHSMVTNCCLL